MFVGSVVVDHEVQVDIGRHGGIDALQEAQELLVAMARPALREDLSVGDVECREEGRRAVPFIIVRDAVDVAQPHRQYRFSRIRLSDWFQLEAHGRAPTWTWRSRSTPRSPNTTPLG